MPPAILFQTQQSQFYTKSQETANSIQDHTLLSQVFFQPANIKLIQKQLIKQVYLDTDRAYLIEEQDPDDILQVMHQVFAQHAKSLPMITDKSTVRSEIPNQIRTLNSIVVSETVPNIISELTMYDSYLERAFGQIEPMNRPRNVSSAGSKILPSLTQRLE